MEQLKPFLVDVPVRVNVWIREECQRKQFEVLKRARPSIMFLISDGGRNEKEWEAINNNRTMFDTQIDWDCKVYKIYEEKNNGLYTMSRKGAQLIWSVTDRCIFLEDDYVPSVCYFKYCAELLEKYKDDTRITAIAGMNHLGVWDKPKSDYFFSRSGSIWGIATWKRTYEQRKTAMEYKDDEYITKLILKEATHDKYMCKQVLGYAKNEKYEGHVAGGEFYYSLNVYGQHQLFIVPKYNMISNIGCTENGAHADSYNLLPHGIRRIFNMKTYEIEFPLKHPKFVVPDDEYLKKERRIMAVGHPIIAFFRKIESVLLNFKYRGLKGIINKIKKANQRKKMGEN